MVKKRGGRREEQPTSSKLLEGARICRSKSLPWNRLRGAGIRSIFTLSPTTCQAAETSKRVQKEGINGSRSDPHFIRRGGDNEKKIYHY
jgi:hypothetical protein